MKKLIQLSASWCPPCRSWRQILETAKAEGRINVEYEYIELDSGKEYSNSKEKWDNIRTKLDELEFSSIPIRGLPTFVIESNGDREAIDFEQVNDLIK